MKKCICPPDCHDEACEVCITQEGSQIESMEEHPDKKVPLRLDLGSSERREGWLNLDVQETRFHRLDLNILPWPLKSNSIGEVMISHILEHLNSPWDIMKEIHRILVPGGKVTVIVPHADGIDSHTISHKHQFKWSWFNELGKGDETTGIPKLWKEEYHICRVVPHRDCWLDVLASTYPWHWEWIGWPRIQEIEWCGRKI